MHIGYDFDGKIANFLDETLGAVVQEIMGWARQYESDRRYRDAEYLFRRASSNENIGTRTVEPYHNEDVLPTLPSIYEEIGDYPVAEVTQEALLRRLFADRRKIPNEEHIRAVNTYTRLLFGFQQRISDLDFDLEPSIKYYMDSFTSHRIAALDIPLLNEVSLEQGLIRLKPNGDHHCASLHIAAKENAINLAQLLIDKGVRVNSRDSQSCTPLHIAVEYAEPAMVKLFLANFADVAAVDSSMRTLLHAALMGKSAEQTLALLINAKVNMEARDNLRRTALMVAIQDDLPAVARFLIQRGANVDQDGEHNYVYETAPLHLAVEYKKEWAIKLLTETGASLAAMNEEGDTALYLAIKMAQESIVQILLDHSAKSQTAVDQQNNTYDKCLRCAVKNANIIIVDSLLKAGADNCAGGNFGDTALHQAIKEGTDSHAEVAHLLLTHSAPLDAVNHDGNTVFFVAVEYRQPKMLSILIQHAEPDELRTVCRMKNRSGRTPLERAVFLAKDTEITSNELLILHMLQNALGLSPSVI